MAEAEPHDNPLTRDDPGSWEALVERVGPASLLVAIESRLGAFLRTRVTAEDVLQEALMHAWRDRARCEWRGIAAFRGWLLTIIDHRIRDLADRESAVKRGGGVGVIGRPGETDRDVSDGTRFSGGRPRAGTILSGHLAAGSTTPSRVAVDRERAAAMLAALQSIPEDLREVVRMRLFEQRSLEEISASLGLGIGAVRHRLRKGAESYQRAFAASMHAWGDGSAHVYIRDFSAGAARGSSQ